MVIIKLERSSNFLVHAIEENIDYKKPYELLLNKYDTLVVQVDQDIFDFEEAQTLLKNIQNIFSHNEILLTFKGLEIKGVIHG